MKTNWKRSTLAAMMSVLFLIFLLPKDGLGAGATKFTKDLRGESVQLPSSVPERGRLVLISFMNVVSESQIVGAVAIYDDPRTTTDSDYMEIYDGTGRLVSVSWFDGMGIRRTAMDTGLLEGEAWEPQGLLVLLTEGVEL